MIKLFNILHGISLLMGNIKVNITEFVGHSHSTIPIFRHVGNPTMPCFLSSQGLWQLTRKLAWLSITIFSILYLRDSPSYTEVGIKQTSAIRMPTFWEYPRSLPMNKFQTRSPINELGQDLDPRYVPTKFYHDRRRIALRRAVTLNRVSRSKWLISSLGTHLTNHITHEQTQPRSWPEVRSYQVWPQSGKNCTRESSNRLSWQNN